MTKRRLVPAAACAVAALVMAALLALDATPRFMLGDSMSYLMTGRNGVDSYPPDRSWIYGLAARGLVVATHGFRAQMLLDAAGLAAFVFAAVSLLPARRGATLVAIAFAVAIACDPLTQTYVRFTMSDLPAALLFAGFVCGLAGRFAPAPRRHAAAAWLGIVACGAGAVAFRVAYVPIELGTAVLAALPSLARRGTVRPLLLAGPGAARERGGARAAERRRVRPSLRRRPVRQSPVGRVPDGRVQPGADRARHPRGRRAGERRRGRRDAPRRRRQPDRPGLGFAKLLAPQRGGRKAPRERRIRSPRGRGRPPHGGGGPGAPSARLRRRLSAQPGGAVRTGGMAAPSRGRARPDAHARRLVRGRHEPPSPPPDRSRRHASLLAAAPGHSNGAWAPTPCCWDGD